MKKSHIVSYVVILFIILFLFIPLLGTFLFSIATKWQTTILPEGFTFKWYGVIFRDQQFLISLGRSLTVSFVSVILSMVIMIPTIFFVVVYMPKFEKYLSIVVTIPFAIPGVIFAVGLMKLYSNKPIAITGTIWILIGAYFILILPYMFQGVRNSLRSINAVVLMEAAEILSATKLEAFVKVILPNIIKGVTASALLSFSVLFGEFVLTNLLAGGQYSTVQIYLYTKRNESGHLTSAVVIIYFILILILSGIILKISSDKKSNSAQEG